MRKQRARGWIGDHAAAASVLRRTNTRARIWAEGVAYRSTRERLLLRLAQSGLAGVGQTEFVPNAQEDLWYLTGRGAGDGIVSPRLGVRRRGCHGR